jgi:hypothetical protein
LKLSLPRDGVRRCPAPCSSILYVRSFLKNGTDLTVFVMLQVSYACLLVNGVFINLLLNHGVRGLQDIYFFASVQVANARCMCSVIVYFLHCICVCDCDSRHESLIMLSHNVMVRRSHLISTMLSWHDVYVHDNNTSYLSPKPHNHPRHTLCENALQVTANVGGEEPDFPKRGKAIQGPPQPILRPHGHLKCHWLPKFFPLSNLIQPLSPSKPL